MVYEIVLKGRVQGTLSRALKGFEVVEAGPLGTRFRGCVDDQAALHAILGRIAGCNLVLMSVRRVDAAVQDSPPVRHRSTADGSLSERDARAPG